MHCVAQLAFVFFEMDITARAMLKFRVNACMYFLEIAKFCRG